MRINITASSSQSSRKTIDEITLPPDPFHFYLVLSSAFCLSGFWAASVHCSRRSARTQKNNSQAAQTRRTSGLEDNHRRLTLRRAQGMHLAASLFSLDEILQEPRLIAPPARVEPGVVGIQEDIISQTLPYMPAWPELAAIYRAPTIGVAEAIAGGSNIVIVGAAGMGKTVALAHLASLAANLKVKLDADSELEAVPYLYHVADLQFPFDAIQRSGKHHYQCRKRKCAHLRSETFAGIYPANLQEWTGAASDRWLR